MTTLRRLAVTTLLAVAALAGAQTPTTIPISGNLGTLAGTPMPDAYITLLLENCDTGNPQITGYAGIIGTSYQFVADSSGNINGNVWPNDKISCNGTLGATIYARSLYDSNNNQVGQTTCYQVVQSQGNWNINTQTPVACGTTPPNPTNGTFGDLDSTGFFAGNNGSFNTLTVGGVPLGPGGVSYLPLSGGALSGALIGTTATFGGAVAAPAINNASVNNWKNPLAFGVGSNQSANTVTATGSNGTGALTLSSASDFVKGNGVMILHGGPSCGTVKATNCPTGPTPIVAPQGSTGSTSYSYKLACIDGLGGTGPAGTAGTTSTGNASLAGVISGTAAISGNFNRVTWTGITNCYEVAIYRNGALIATQWSGASGTQTFNDVGLVSWTNRDLPSAPPSSGLNDNYEGILQSISGASATVSPTLATSITTATMYHDDSPLIQAAINASPWVDMPPGNWLVRYPINYTKHANSFPNAGEIRGSVNIYCDTGDICLDADGSQNVKFTDLNFETGTTNSSAIQLYLSRDTASGDLAQQIITDHVSFVNEVQPAGVIAPVFGGRGYTGIYNHAAEIQANLYDQFQTDRWMVLTKNNVDNVASVFSATDDRGPNSMSQVDVYSARGSGQVYGEFEGAFTVNYENGYGLGGYLGLNHPWAFEVDAGESARVKINGFRVEGKNGLISIAPGAQFQEPYIWVDLYRVQSPPYASATTPMIYLNDGASMLNAAYVMVDDYGGSGANVAPVVDGINCSVSLSTFYVGIWQSQGTCNGGSLTGAGNTIFGSGQSDYALADTYQFTASQTVPAWIHLGKWTNRNQPRGDTLRISLLGGNGFTSAAATQGEADILIRMGNQTGAPNLAGVQMVTWGSTGGSPGAAVYDQVKVAATGGSTSSTNATWDVYIHETQPFSGGSYKVIKSGDDVWAADGGISSDPGTASSSLVVGTVNQMALQGAAASFTSVTVPGTSDGCATFSSGLLTSTGTACGAGGSGVVSINSTTGAFTFSGAGVSCTGATCTFSGTGSGVTSVAMTVPSWLSIAGSPITSSGTLAVSAATGQTAHQVIGTCGSATSFGPCALVAGDIPTLNQNTTGTAAGLSGSQTANTFYAAPNGSSGTASFRAIVAADVPTLNQNTTGTAGGLTGTPNVVLGTAKATTFYTNLDFCVNGGTWPSCTACTTSATIDPANGNNQTLVLTAGSTCALTFTQPAGKEVVIQLTVIQSSSGGFNGLISGCTWPGGAGGGAAPVITPSSGAIDTVAVKLDSVHSRCQIAQAFN